MDKNSKEYVVNNIKNLLEDLEDNNSKKCKNLSKWLNNYVAYLQYENNFDSKRLCRYRKGEVLKVNLGFNIGSEEGGVHYCMVLDKENSKNSPVVTVIPLTSVKPNKDLSKLKKGEIYLGDELFRLLNLKIKTIYENLTKSIEKTQIKINQVKDNKEVIINKLEDIETQIKNLEEDDKIEDKEKLLSILYDVFKETEKDYMDRNNKIKEIQSEINSMNSEQKFIEQISKEISMMKKGSIALVNQITTISKMRIIDPKNDKYVLSGIKFSSEKLNLIDEELRKMYLK